MAEASKVDQNEFMTHGITEESSNQNKQGYQLSQEQVKVTGEMDFMETVIHQRKEDISSIANIMNDINAIAKDIAVETKA